METLKLASITMTSTADKQANLRQAEALVQQAAAQGADWVLLPEMFPYMGSYKAAYEAAEFEDGPLNKNLAALACRLQITLFAGSCGERPTASTEGPAPERKVYNSLYVFSPEGKLIAKYRKTHLFHLRDTNDKPLYCETDGFLAGDSLLAFEHEGWRVGLAICYDLRFPELFSTLARQGPLDIIMLPAAFTYETGQHHWQLLLAARAVENLCYVVAANQTGQHGPGKTSWGHSLIINPWGTIVADSGVEVGIAFGEASKAELQAYRQRLPALSNRRPELYRR